MLNPNAIVSKVLRFTPSPEEMLKSKQGVVVELEGERQARLDPDNPRSAGLLQVLDGLHKQRLPAYFELDPETAVITRLLIPHISRVISVKATGDGSLDISLGFSHARHLLRADQADRADLEKLLREAVESGKPVILTEDDDHNVIDVQFFTPSPDGPEVPFPPFPPQVPHLEKLPKPWFKELILKVWYWCWWPWWWFFGCKCISESKAQQVFNAMSAQSCDPLTVPAPCIPFLYPDDGCWARAHEMCRLMIDMGRSPKKVWIQGSLHVSTANNPSCNVYWGWHVAPTLCVRTSLFSTKTMVIDPSLFAAPVSKATWKGVQGDPSATLTDSDAAIYYLWGSVTDPTYSETNYYLNFYRLQLQNRAVAHGPPPYACP